MLLSFVIPVYNTEPGLLKRCVASIDSVEISKEIIIIDDGSSNKQTLDTIKEIGQSTVDVKILNKQNSGPSAARNYGMDIATGEYIVFVDSDDFIISENFNRSVKLLDNMNIHLLAFKTGINLDQNAVNKPEKLEIFSTSREDKNDEYSFGVVWGKIYAREIINGVRFDETLKYGEDNLFNIEVLSHVERINYVDVVAYSYSMNPDSLCHKYNPECAQQFKDTIIKLEQAYNRYKMDNNSLYATVIFHFYLNLILKQQVFNSLNRKNLFQQIRMGQEILCSDPYKYVLEKYVLTETNIKLRIMYYLLKHKLCWIAYLLNNISVHGK